MTSHDCPSCSRSFSSRRGLGVHHSRVHGERLPNRECARCGQSFYSPYAKKYCSEQCLVQSGTFEGESNPNFRDAKSATECNRCGTPFEYYPSEKPGHFCSECVENEDWREPPVIEGADHPRWNGGRLELECDVCGATVERYPSHVTGEAVVCSKDCHRQWLSEAFEGEDHPNWRGGGHGSYGRGWNEVRRRALDRDGYACTICGTSRSELGRNPDAHHIIPVRSFVESRVFTIRDAHTIDNVVTLCPSCHRRAEFGHVSPAELRYRAGVDGNSHP